MDIKNGVPNIVVIDNFLTDIDNVRRQALESRLEHHPEAHKGMRAPGMDIPLQVKRVFEDELDGPVTSGYCCYQLCVAGDQLVYHSDVQQYAAVLFLTPDAPPSTGTSFFRSKQTRLRSAPTFEDVEAGRPIPDMQRDLEQLERATYAGKLLDRTAWEEIDRVGNVYNRLVIWNARLIHSASDYFGHDLESGRLFLMFFFDVG